MWISASFSRVDTKNPTGVYGSQIPLLRRRPAGDKRMIRLLFAVGPVCQQDVGGEALHILSIYRSSLHFILSCSRAGSASHHQLTPKNLHTTAGLVFRLLLKLQKNSNYQFSPLFAAKTAKKSLAVIIWALCLCCKQRPFCNINYKKHPGIINLALCLQPKLITFIWTFHMFGRGLKNEVAVSEG